MKYRTLGRTDQRVSLLSLGSGGASRLGQASNASRQDMQRFVRHALDLGINLIDTAPVYEESEAILGEALAGVPRDSYLLCTKFGAGRGDPQPGALRASLERSLTRLRTDAVDVMFLHGVTPTNYDQSMRFVDELRQAQQDGLTRWLGATEVYEWDPSHSALERALGENVFDVMMVGHNLLTPGGLTSFIPAAASQNVGLMVMCAVRTVITTPELLGATIREWKADGALAPDAVPDEAPLDWVLGPEVETIADAAYKFAAESPAVATVLTGTGNIDHLEANVRAVLGPPLPGDVSKRLRDIFTPVQRSVIPPSRRRVTGG